MITTLILCVIAGIVFPAYIFLTYKNINKRIKHNPAYRVVDYKQTILIFWLLTFGILGNNFFSSDYEISLGLSFEPGIASLIISFLITGVIVYLFSQLKADEESAPALQEKMQDIYHYLPKSQGELRWFTGLSVSAGICEEIIFRGFLWGALSQFVNIWIAVVVVNIIFALTHIGSGKQNLISSFVLGLVFSGIYYISGSLWPAIILHAALDIYSGILGYKVSKILRERQEVINS